MPLTLRSEGLFYGERINRVSREARLWFPYFICASNNMGRIRIHYPDFLRTCFAGFNPPPTESEVSALFDEYFRNYLLFIYQDQATRTYWGQWDTETPRFTTHAERTSPAPPLHEFEKWRKEYQQTKTARNPSLFNRLIPLSVPHGDSRSVTEPHGDSRSLTVPHGDSPLREDRIGLDRIGKNKRAGFVLPDWIPAETWNAFEDTRKTMRKPMTDRARELTVRALAKLKAEGHDPVAVLEQSVQRSWQGVFAVRPESARAESNHKPAAKKHLTRDASQIAKERRERRENSHA